MSLNNRGWGLREMLFICAVLFFCVILAAVLINQLYSSLPIGNLENTSSDNYAQIEKNIKEAAQIYYRKNEDESRSLITSEELILEGYLKESKMRIGKDSCTGYVIIENNTYSPYITCENYETEGY